MKRGETVREAAQVKIRIKKPLRTALEKSATRRGVSLNAEIVTRLEQSFAPTSAAEIARQFEIQWQHVFVKEVLKLFMGRIPEDVQLDLAHELGRRAGRLERQAREAEEEEEK
jgi:hypothetical protein